MIWAKLALDAGTRLAFWLYKNQHTFGPVLNKTGNFLSSAISDPHGAVHRVGNTIVFGQPDAGGEILGFIEQAQPQLNQIASVATETKEQQQTMLSTLGSLQLGQGALSSSVAALTSLSMVSLGFTAILPLVLKVQLEALSIHAQ